MIENSQYLKLFKSVTTFVLDVDGVLTDGSLLVTDNGEQLRTMNIRDGYAMQRAVKKGYNVIVITGGSSKGVEQRLNGLGIQHVFTGVEKKIEILKSISGALNFDLSNTIYIGDDIPDIDAMKICGIPCCPANAAHEVISVSKYISPKDGGSGCVRDIIEKVLNLKNDWG